VPELFRVERRAPDSEQSGPGVNLNVYTETDLGQKREAVNSLEKAIQIS